MNSPSPNDAAKLAALKQDMNDRIRFAESDVARASRYLATLLIRVEIGKQINGTDISGARDALARARKEHDYTLLVRDALPAMLEDARQEMQAAQAINADRIAASRQQARKAYEAEKYALERDWGSLGRQRIASRGAALRALAVKAGCIQSFRDTVASWSGRTSVDVIEQLV